MRCNDDSIIVRRLSGLTSETGLITAGMFFTYALYEIVAVGDGHYHRQSGKIVPMEVKVGDRVLISPNICNLIETAFWDDEEEKVKDISLIKSSQQKKSIDTLADAHNISKSGKFEYRFIDGVNPENHLFKVPTAEECVFIFEEGETIV